VCRSYATYGYHIPNTTKTTVYLDAESYRRLQALAVRTGRPTAELVREAVEEYASRHSLVRLPKSLGAGKSGRRDLGTRAELLLKGMGENR
jgi:hypothetical protein